MLVSLLACKKTDLSNFKAHCNEISKITNFKIVVSGDSHTQAIPSGGHDSLWVNMLKKYYQQFFDTVTLINLGIGGTYVEQFMPKWYRLSDSRLNIDTCLKLNPDLLVISFSGNHTVFGYSADTNIYCFKYAIDTLRKLNKMFMMTGQPPRQKTFVYPVTTKSYYDSSMKINNFFKMYCSNEYVENYKTMEDTVRKMVPWAWVVGGDGLHMANAGERVYYQNHIDSWISKFIVESASCK